LKIFIKNSLNLIKKDLKNCKNLIRFLKKEENYEKDRIKKIRIFFKKRSFSFSFSKKKRKESFKMYLKKLNLFIL